MSRAERRRRTARIVARRAKIDQWASTGRPPQYPDPRVTYRDWKEDESWEEYRQRKTVKWLGRCRNLHPLDCGNPRCGLCASYKRWSLGKTLQEKKNDLSFKEQVNGSGEAKDVQD